MSLAPPLFTLAIDSREQNPLNFEPWVRRGDVAGTVRTTIPTGDYSLVGFESRVAVERKSVTDLLGVVGRDRARFERELARAADLDFFAVLVEAPLAAVLDGDDRSMVSGGCAVSSLLTWSVVHRAPVFFADDRRQAAAIVVKLLGKWFKHRVAEPQGMRGRSKL